MNARAARRNSRPGRPPGGSEATVHAVLEATLELLGEHGYADLRVEEVAKRAGLNKTSVYRRWPTKKDLVSAAMLSLREETTRLPDTGTLRGDLVAMLKAINEKVRAPRGAAIVRAFVTSEDAELLEIARTVRARQLAVPLPPFERAVARGEIRAADVHMLVEMTISPIHYHAILLRESVDDAFIASVVDAALYGFLGRVRGAADVKSPRASPNPSSRRRRPPR